MIPPFTLCMLSDHPHLVPACAAWEAGEWGGPLEQALAEYAAARPDGLPLTVVAVDAAGAAAGMVSLWVSDCPLRPEITPWMASLYVAPAARGHGLGSLLFARAETEARRLGIDRLHLMTQESEDHYRALGWQTFDRIDGPGAMAGAALMRKDLAG
ncbi:GNAT family N-acetyltransferase [Novispirillum sp. DQ9]|uniref:GNAT family N-acetyltransferase n=1 Tax=Novispirillum sp. DQ9 TaxID=3398612 RepID=UPI003C7976B9